MPGSRMPGGQREAIALTANITLTNYDVGKLFTNRGASGTVTVTLPSPSAENAGGEILFAGIADQTFTVQCTGKLVIINDAAANSISLGTSSEKIGGVLGVMSDGTSWIAMKLHVGANTVTTTT